jgi:uncharacterized protein YcbK (DUF882 family)
MTFEDCIDKMRCQCGCRALKQTNVFIQAFLKLWGLMGGDVLPTSGTRCYKHNVEVGGASSSRHLISDAVDLACRDADYQERLVDLARTCGFRGIGWGKNFVHLDCGAAREWRYSADGKIIPA